MRQWLITILFVLISFSALAGDTTIVKLMKKVIDIEVPADQKHFYLLNNGNPATTNEVKSLCYQDPKIKDAVIVDFLKAMEYDTVTIQWMVYHLPKAKCVNKPHVSKPGTLAKIFAGMPEVNPNTGEIIPNTSHKVAPKVLEDFGSKVFSKPLITADGQYAFVASRAMMSASYYVFKNSNGNWDLISQTGWIE